MDCNCFFCEDGRFALNHMLGVEAESSVIYEDENVFVSPDIAPVMKGHYLIVTKEHINSYGNADEKIYASLEAAKKFLITSVFHTDNVLFWEHGAVVSHYAGGCIDHAHLHAIPTIPGLNIDRHLNSLDYIDSPRQDLTFEALKQLALSRQPYISYEYGTGGKYFRRVKWLPTQFFRLMVSQYQPQEYNWKLRYKEKDSLALFRSTLEMAKSKK